MILDRNLKWKKARESWSRLSNDGQTKHACGKQPNNDHQPFLYYSTWRDSSNYCTVAEHGAEFVILNHAPFSMRRWYPRMTNEGSLLLVVGLILTKALCCATMKETCGIWNATLQRNAVRTKEERATVLTPKERLQGRKDNYFVVIEIITIFANSTWHGPSDPLDEASLESCGPHHTRERDGSLGIA